jgi:signal peptidase II
MQIKKLQIIWFLLSLFIIGLDQLSKYLITHTLDLWQSIPLIPGFFDFTLRHNTGAAYSFLDSASGWQRWFFIGLALIISAVIIVWMRKLSIKEKLEGYALALILGGALGNLCDRVIHGYVIDFILFYYEKWQFPAFNIADSAISIGVVLLIPSLFKSPNVKKINVANKL